MLSHLLWSLDADPCQRPALAALAPDLDGDLLMAGDHVAVKTAMEKEQERDNARVRRPIAREASGDCKMSSCITP